MGEEFVAALSVDGDVFSGSEDVGCSVRELEVSTVEVFLAACSPFEEYFRGVIDKSLDFVRCVVFFAVSYTHLTLPTKLEV